MSLLDFAAEVAREAGKRVRRRWRESTPLEVRHKSGGRGPVTEMDTWVEEFIVRCIRDKLPQDGVLGEEGGQSGDGGRCWVIDPIDGTRNFVHRYPQCAVSLALCEQGRAKLGVVHDIVADETFSATDGGGAYCEQQRLRVSDARKFSESLFIASGQMNGDINLWPATESLAKKTAGCRRTGATALDFAWVAAGRADMMVCGPVQFWDVAAGGLLLREAGGLISDVDGATTFAFGTATKSFVAGAPKVFVPFLNELKTRLA